MPLSLDEFEGAATAAVEQAPDDGWLAVVVDDDAPDGSAGFAYWPADEPDLQDKCNQVLFRSVGCAAMATRTRYSPTELGPSQDAWMTVVVDPWETARFLVYGRRSKRWWRIRPTDAPWFALANAGGLRTLLADKLPLELKEVTPDKYDLLKRPIDVPTPPTDDRGRL